MDNVPDKALCQGETEVLTPHTAIHVITKLIAVDILAHIALISLHWRTSVPAAVSLT